MGIMLMRRRAGAFGSLAAAAWAHAELPGSSSAAAIVAVNANDRQHLPAAAREVPLVARIPSSHALVSDRTADDPARFGTTSCRDYASTRSDHHPDKSTYDSCCLF